MDVDFDSFERGDLVERWSFSFGGFTSHDLGKNHVEGWFLMAIQLQIASLPLMGRLSSAFSFKNVDYKLIVPLKCRLGVHFPLDALIRSWLAADFFPFDTSIGSQFPFLIILSVGIWVTFWTKI